MINWAIRYQPVLNELRRRRPAVVLEVGSGPEGLGLFWRGRVVGVDIAFKRQPLHRAVATSALALPFLDRSWPLVVSCDMLEHTPSTLRRATVAEVARVTGQALFLAFPSGAAAQACYTELAQRFPSHVPDWLAEHVAHGLPDAEEVAGWLQADGWTVRLQWYESVAAHGRLMRWETRRLVQAFTYSLMRLAGPWLAPHWPRQDDEPLLRALLIAERLR